MNIKPIGNRIVIKVKEKKEKNISGIILVEKNDVKPRTGEVVAISSSLESDDIKIGDIILYSHVEANMIGENNEEYLIINLENVLAIINEDGK